MENCERVAPEIIDNLRRIFQAINEYSRTAERVTGLTGPQLWALKILENTSPLRVSYLAHQMYLHPATVVGILDRLETKGLVSRTRSQEDRRAVDLNLTDLGWKLARTAPEDTQVILGKGLEKLSDDQYLAVEEGMMLMVRILCAEHLIPQPLHG